VIPDTITIMAGMGSTTRTETVSGLARQAIHFVLVALLATVLLTMSWPRLRAALHYLPVDVAIDNYYLSGELPAGSRGSLQQKALESLSLHEHQHYWDGLGLLYYLQGLDGSLPLYLQRESFEQSVDATSRSLELAPIQPRAWLRRALSLGWLSFRDTGIGDAFKMSVYTGRVETALSILRLQLGYSRLGQLDEEARSLLRDQTLLAWRLRRQSVITAMKQGSLDFRRVSSLLIGTDSGVVRDMEASLAGGAR
jgi:hypothetical protein